MTTTTMNRGAGASMAFMWTTAGISVSGSGGHPEPQRRPETVRPADGKGAPAGDLSSQRLPFVSEVQRALRDLGYRPGPIDGAFGPQTRMALEKYQVAERLTVTGLLDGETLQRLDVYRRLFRSARDLPVRGQ
jgi:peptidoglycan hydrolase-like protein with peptidoglycan-binding domain